MRYEDRTDDEWDILTDQWHKGDSELSLQKYLELNDVEYFKFAHGLRDKELTNEQQELLENNMYEQFWKTR